MPSELYCISTFITPVKALASVAEEDEELS